MNWLQKASMKIFGIQNCNYLKQDSARLEQTAQDKRCPQSAENLCLSFASTEVPSRLKAFSISETSLPLLVKSAELGHIDNFDLSGLNSAMQRTDDLKAELSSKRAFLKELEVMHVLTFYPQKLKSSLLIPSQILAAPKTI